MTSQQIALLTAALAFCASLIAGGIALYNSRITRFTTERWWERKAASYTDVIEVLVKLRFAAAALKDASIIEKILPDSRLDRIKELGELTSLLYRTEVRGAFTMSGPALAVIESARKGIVQVLHDATEMKGSTTAAMDAVMSAKMPPLVDAAIAQIRRLAKDDLRVK